MQLAKTFKIHNGYCHILLDKIVFSSSENPDIKIDDKKYITIWSVLFSLIIAVCIAGAITGFLTNEIYYGSIATIFAVYFFYRFRLLNDSNVTEIIRNDIVKIDFQPSLYSAQHAHFIIRYKTHSGIPRNKKVFLTGNYASTNDPIIAHALVVMEAEFG